ncbi:hypothetical protein TRVA0_026S00122 [Trichomonascus vanleenenianus]|uniref:Yhi9p n=1 Tax=Trichomonascus vanleenenianus TaxID=2268995 RepID=UPI003EC96D88
MEYPIYQVDAFANAPFTGNPAAVVPLDKWLDDDVLKNIAAENNLSETAFYVARETGGAAHEKIYELRWFTPTVEVDLCGHATMATAAVIFQTEPADELPSVLRFETKSGELQVTRTASETGKLLLTMSFPATIPIIKDDPLTEDVAAALGITNDDVSQVLESTDLIVVIKTQERLNQLKPNFDHLVKSSAKNFRGVVVCTTGNETDIASRFFAPQSGVPEDPVTGSTFSWLTPYWSSKLGKSKLTVVQGNVERRVGNATIELSGERVLISGHAHLYMTGRIIV